MSMGTSSGGWLMAAVSENVGEVTGEDPAPNVLAVVFVDHNKFVRHMRISGGRFGGFPRVLECWNVEMRR